MLCPPLGGGGRLHKSLCASIRPPFSGSFDNFLCSSEETIFLWWVGRPKSDGGRVSPWGCPLGTRFFFSFVFFFAKDGPEVIGGGIR